MTAARVDEPVRYLVDLAAYQMGLRAADIRGPSQERRYCRARTAVIWCVRQTTALSYYQIGQRMLGRHYTVIGRAARRADNLRKTDPAFFLLTDRILANFEGDTTCSL